MWHFCTWLCKSKCYRSQLWGRALILVLYACLAAHFLWRLHITVVWPRTHMSHVSSKGGGGSYVEGWEHGNLRHTFLTVDTSLWSDRLRSGVDSVCNPLHRSAELLIKRYVAIFYPYSGRRKCLVRYKPWFPWFWWVQFLAPVKGNATIALRMEKLGNIKLSSMLWYIKVGL